MFQSLDWVDVDFDISTGAMAAGECSFNPSTGLMLISTGYPLNPSACNALLFQSLDWVDVDFDFIHKNIGADDVVFQSLDWVDVDFDFSLMGLVSPTIQFQSLDWVDVDFD